MGIPESSTIEAASGSHKMFHSEDAVLLPSPIEPAREKILFIFIFNSGYILKNTDKLVKGPVVTTVIPGLLMMVSCNNCTEFLESGVIELKSFLSGSSPDCRSSTLAISLCLTNGFLAPLDIGMLRFPIWATVIHAF